MPTSHRRVTGLIVAIALVAGCSPVSITPSPSAESSTTPSPSTIPSPTPLASSESSPSPSIGTTLNLNAVVEGLHSPLDIADAPDGSDRLFIAQQTGQIRIVDHGTLLPSPYLDIAKEITSGGERGLLGIAFHPDFANDPRVFVDYTDLNGNTVVSSFTTSLDADALDPDSEVQLLHVKQPFANHNGGAVVFGPDGKLYISLGDGGSAGDPEGNGRNLKTDLAKILRIDVDVPEGSDPPYAIPSDNPYAAGPGGAKPEIWETGLRNPWRISFDPPTGDLWIGDVGQAAWEEVDVARGGVGGLDFGWNTMEGFHCYQPSTGCDQSGLTLPVTEYGHDLGCAIVGGMVVRGTAEPTLAGRYIFGDDCSGRIWSIDAATTGKQEPRLEAYTGRVISSFHLGPNGEIYITDLGNGVLLRATYATN
jgi:glucose/arabinose dehydrogenase